MGIYGGGGVFIYHNVSVCVYYIVCYVYIFAIRCISKPAHGGISGREDMGSLSLLQIIIGITQLETNAEWICFQGLISLAG